MSPFLSYLEASTLFEYPVISHSSSFKVSEPTARFTLEITSFPSSSLVGLSSVPV
mgnify:FL=1